MLTRKSINAQTGRASAMRVVNGCHNSAGPGLLGNANELQLRGRRDLQLEAVPMSPLARHDSSPNRHRSNTRASDQRRPTESAHTTNLWTLKCPQFGNTSPHFDGLCFVEAHPVCLWISLKLARGSKDPQPTLQLSSRSDDCVVQVGETG